MISVIWVCAERYRADITYITWWRGKYETIWRASDVISSNQSNMQCNDVHNEFHVNYNTK